jgi:3-oxoacyl-[acyl-carrier protein] reductase
VKPDLAGQIAVVTGGTRGIGAAVSVALLEAGATVRAIYRSDDDAAKAFASEALRFGTRLSVHRLDVADALAVERFWGDTETAVAGGVQILVNNAGIRRDAIVGLMSAEDWNAVLDTNLSGSFHMAKYAVRSMMRRKYGRIVFVTSPAAEHGFAGQGNYAASKAGQIGLMRALAREVAKKGITANCVSPGFVETEFIADVSEDVKKSHLSMVPLGRYGTPQEIAWAVVAMCAPEATYVNGSVLEVTGGI